MVGRATPAATAAPAWPAAGLDRPAPAVEAAVEGPVLDEAQTRALHDEGVRCVTSVVAKAMPSADSRVVSLMRFRRAEVA